MDTDARWGLPTQLAVAGGLLLALSTLFPWLSPHVSAGPIVLHSTYNGFQLWVGKLVAFTGVALLAEAAVWSVAGSAETRRLAIATATTTGGAAVLACLYVILARPVPGGGAGTVVRLVLDIVVSVRFGAYLAFLGACLGFAAGVLGLRASAPREVEVEVPDSGPSTGAEAGPILSGGNWDAPTDRHPARSA